VSAPHKFSPMCHSINIGDHHHHHHHAEAEGAEGRYPSFLAGASLPAGYDARGQISTAVQQQQQQLLPSSCRGALVKVVLSRRLSRTEFDTASRVVGAFATSSGVTLIGLQMVGTVLLGCKFLGLNPHDLVAQGLVG